MGRLLGLPRLMHIYHALLLLATVVAAYGNAFGGAFQFDDYRVIVLNPLVQTWSAWWSDMPGMRPLLKLSYVLNHEIGAGLSGFHAFNIVLHAANTLLVYALCRRWRSEAWPTTVFPLLAALIFAAHPVNTEAVTYVSGRSSALLTFFYLAALLGYDRVAASGGLWLPFSVASFLLALASKETAATLPLALLLWDATDPRMPFCWRTAMRRQAWYWGILLCAVGIFFSLPVYRWLLSVSLELRSFHDNLLTHLNAMAWLVGQWWWPIRLNADPMLPVIRAWSPVSMLETGVIIGITTWALVRRCQQPLMAFAALWSILHLLPSLAMARLDPANERQLYLAGIGFCMMAAWAAVAIIRDSRYRRLAVTVSVSLVITLGVLCHARNRVYANEISYWKAVVRASPHNARASNNLGFAYREAGRDVEAEQAFLRALALDPDYKRARFNLEALWRDRPRGADGYADNQ